MSGPNTFPIAEGTSSSRPDGDAAAMPNRGACGKSGPAHPLPAPGHDISQIDPAAHPGGGPKDGSADVPSRSRPLFDAAVENAAAAERPVLKRALNRAAAERCAARQLVTVHISTDAASLLALLAAERGESPGSAVARLVVAEIERKGGIACV